MRATVLAFAVALGGCCTWSPRPFPQYPDGLTIIRLDTNLLREACPVKVADGGGLITPEMQITGCYNAAQDTIYLDDSCDGAKTLAHEMAHRQGIQNPRRAGFNW